MLFAGHDRIAVLSRSQGKKQQLQPCKNLKHDSIQRSSVAFEVFVGKVVVVDKGCFVMGDVHVDLQV